MSDVNIEELQKKAKRSIRFGHVAQVVFLAVVFLDGILVGFQLVPILQHLHIFH